MVDVDSKIAEMMKTLSTKANAYRESILLLTANKTRLFTKIAGKTVSVADVARLLNWDPRAAQVFLNALTAMGFLQKQADWYSNADISEKLLTEDSEYYQGDILDHNRHLWDRWSQIEDVLQSGKSLRERGVKRTPDQLKAFINGMANIARFSALKLWDEIGLVHQKRMLDLGGGPGIYAFEACRRLPDLTAVVFDLPEVEPIFQEHRARSGVADRVMFYAGDIHTDPLPAGCDVVLLSSIIHSWSADQNQALLQKLDDTMPSRSLLIIKDFFISDDGTEPLFAALFSVNMLIGTEGGKCYTRNEVEELLHKTNFQPRDFIPLTDQAGVIIAVKE